MVKFVSYDGCYPCLCGGELIVEIDGKETNLGACLYSGGYCGIDDSDWDEYVTKGRWSVVLPPEFSKYKEEIAKVVNENVSFGCCGGCI